MIQIDEHGNFHGEDGKFVEKTGANRLVKIPFSFFAEAGLCNQTPQELRKGIRKIMRRIAEHQYKLDNPSEFHSNWDTYSDARKNYAILYWKKEIASQERAIRERIEKLKELGEDVSEYDS